MATVKHNRGPHHLSQRGAASDLASCLGGVALLSEGAPASPLLAGGVAGMTPTVAQGVAEHGVAEHGVAGPAPAAVDEFKARLDHALDALEVELGKAGEVLAELGSPAGYGPTGLSEAQLGEVVGALEARMGKLGADMCVLRTRKLPAPALGAPDSWVADVAVHPRPGVRPAVEVRVAVVGNVDSGKSTMVGVLTRSMLDDGRGLARAKVFKHSHEESTGRTSCIGQHSLCLGSGGEILNDTSFKPLACADYVARSSKVITLVDCAGHEKYFKSTCFGLTGHMPDFACLMVGANAGIVGMAKEHLGVALALKIPAFFVITKVDICPEHILKHSLQALQTILKKPGVRKKPFLVRNRDDVVTCARHIHSDSLAPIFLTSAVTGQGLELVRLFFSLLPQRQAWGEASAQPAEFLIDETFGVPGVGTVVAGTVKRGVITPNTPLLLGPDPGDGSFRLAAVKSIHFKRLPVGKVVAGQTASLALKKVRRSAVRKGMVLVDEAAAPRASWEFDAEIAVLTHATTIQPRYQAVIHCEIVRQAAQVIAMSTERLRSGDRACVRFRFLQRPEYITPAMRFVFREGRTKGIGVVVATEASPAPAPAVASAASAAAGQ